MLSSPVLIAETLHRSEIVGELRSAEIQKNQAQAAEIAHKQLEKDQHKDTEVEKATRVEIDPHDLGEKQPGYQPGKKRSKKSKEELEAQSLQKKLRNLGAGHIDIIA
jgi:hypothetical protein